MCIVFLLDPVLYMTFLGEWVLLLVDCGEVHFAVLVSLYIIAGKLMLVCITHWHQHCVLD